MSDDCDTCDVAICPNAYECYEIDGESTDCWRKKRLKILHETAVQDRNPEPKRPEGSGK